MTKKPHADLRRVHSGAALSAARLATALRLTSELDRAGDPAHNGLEANVWQLQGVGPVPNPPGTIVEVGVLTVWKCYNLEPAGS